MKEMKDKRVLVIGAGVSGLGCVRLLNRIGACPVLLEQNAGSKADEIRKKLVPEDREATEIICGELPEEVIKDLYLVVPSPGVPLDTPFMEKFRERGLSVISEIELAYRFMDGKLAAITGTNGKTTTTSLVGEIMKALRPHSGENVFVVGNIGESFTGHTLETTKDSVTVAEISSFQSEAFDKFHADVSAILNITPDHLDRHHTMEAYAVAKEHIANGQTKTGKDGSGADYCVLNYNDPYTHDFGLKRCSAEVIWFSSSERPFYNKSLWLDGDEIKLVNDKTEPDKDTVLLHFSDCRIKGICNAENVMAAYGIVSGLGIDAAAASDVIRSFKPVAHRIEYITTKNGVDWYNDSKATNPDAAIQGIRAMDKKTVLIGGGYDKGNSYDEWIDEFEGRVKELVLTGQTAEIIEETCLKKGFKNIYRASSFEDALAHAAKTALPGEAVLLSPACASWGMFRNYEERGDAFREFAEGITEEV